MKAAVLIIDVLQEFFQEGRLKNHRKKLTKNINELVDFCRTKKLPIIWIRQEFKSDLSDAPVPYRRKNIRITIESTPGSQLLPELNFKEDDTVFVKKRYSAFFGTQLNDFLKKMNIDTIIMAGVNTHACVRTAAIDAYQLDYDVILAKDCVDSYDEEHHKISLKYLDGIISTLLTNKTIMRKIP